MRLFLLGLLFISSTAFAQKKDSLIIVPDSVSTISINDIVAALKYMEDKVTKKQYDEAVTYYNLLIQFTDNKRRKIIKP